MSTTVGHIRGIVTLDTSGMKAKAAEAKAEARALKQDVERQKPTIDANTAPFLAAVARADAAATAANERASARVGTLEAKIAKAATSQETALGKVRIAQAALDDLQNRAVDEPVSVDKIEAAEQKLSSALRAHGNAVSTSERLTHELAQTRARAADQAMAAASKEKAAAASLVQAAEAVAAAHARAAGVPTPQQVVTPPTSAPTEALPAAVPARPDTGALEAKISRSADAQANALGKVRVAEAELSALRGRYMNQQVPHATLVAGEEKLAAAKRQHASASKTTATLEADLERVRAEAARQAEENAAQEAAAAAAAKKAAQEAAAAKVKAAEEATAAEKKAAEDARRAAEETAAAKQRAAEQAREFAAAQEKAAKQAVDGGTRLAAARDAEQRAAQAVARAERDLAAVRADAGASADRIAAAEEKVTAAVRQAALAKQRAADVVKAEADARTRAAEMVAAAEEKAAAAAEKAGEKAAQEADKAAEAEEDAANRRVASLAKIAGGYTALGAVGLVAGTVAAAGVALLPIAMGVAAGALLKGEAQVSDAWGGLASKVVTESKRMAKPLTGDMVNVAGQFALSWQKMRYSVDGMFRESAPSIRQLSQGISEFAENAVPGMATAVSRSEPAMIGFRGMLGDLGAGVGDLFENVSEDTHSTGRVLDSFGGVARSALGGTGTLLSQLTSSFAPYSAQFESLVALALRLVTQLSGGALPELMAAGGMTMQVLAGLLDVIEPIAPELGKGIGIVLSAAAAWKVYQAAITLVTKLNPAPLIAKAGEALSNFSGGADRAAKGAAGAEKSVGALSRAMSPLGVAIGLIGIAVAGYALAQQEATEFGDQYTQGLAKGGDAAKGAVDKYREALLEMRRLKEIQDSINSGSAEKEFKVGPESFFKKVNLWESEDDLPDSIGNLYDAPGKIKEAKEEWDKYLESVGPVERAQAELNLAVAEFGPTSIQAQTAGAKLTAEQRSLAESQRQAALAAMSHNDKLIQQMGFMLAAAGASNAYDAALLGLEGAEKAVGEAVKQHGANSLEARQANNAYEAQLISVINAIGQKTLAENANEEASVASERAMEAQYREIIRLAGAAGQNAPDALKKMISQMDVSKLSAMGVTVSVNEAGQAVYRLPNGKTIKIDGLNQAALDAIEAVNRKELKDKTMYINAVMRMDDRVAQTYGDSGRNKGGWVPGSGPDRDSVWIHATPGEYVVNRRASRKHARVLEMINAAGGGDVTLPQSSIAGTEIPEPRMPGLPAQAIRQAAAARSASSTSSTTPAPAAQHRSTHITLNAVPGISTMQQLEDMQHELEVLGRG
ncbi:hypothetical protein [Actinosynnema mirum]|uniref:Uncharacterized protein n=1 Tax=Actinosynnema mirum (strain ATCC 29888 / DSM 43827 / JCM 3225 / NBRC 14064 / NCIMB 13271 / NRRL B-12336 / IMRU 3971 / 101) TaxID=446462 RepID=C6WBL2_ACTMD|nr:hypothetical protein [Actinosynnema mirum]ACU35580.1 hypothetical protein Amir_1631 [Actinosynnema mirum DSM 43827]